MEFAFVVYAISVIGKLNILLTVLAICFGIALLGHLICIADCRVRTVAKDFKMRFAVIPIFLLSLSTFTPSERTMYLMAGAYAGQSVVQSQLGQDVIKVLELKVKEQLNELSNKPEKEKK